MNHYIVTVNGETGAEEIIDHRSEISLSNAESLIALKKEVREELMKKDSVIYDNCTLSVQPVFNKQKNTSSLKKAS